jgi:hypothetical protein
VQGEPVAVGELAGARKALAAIAAAFALLLPQLSDAKSSHPSPKHADASASHQARTGHHNSKAVAGVARDSHGKIANEAPPQTDE